MVYEIPEKRKNISHIYNFNLLKMRNTFSVVKIFNQITHHHHKCSNVSSVLRIVSFRKPMHGGAWKFITEKNIYIYLIATTISCLQSIVY